MRPFPEARHEAGPEHERPVMDRNKRLTGNQQRAGVGARRRLPERLDGEQAEEADDDERAFDEPGGHVAEGERLVLAPQQRKQHHRCRDVGDHGQDLEEGTQRDALARAGTKDVIRVIEQRAVGEDSGHREDQGQDEEDADRERDLSRRSHGSFPFEANWGRGRGWAGDGVGPAANRMSVPADRSDDHGTGSEIDRHDEPRRRG